MITYITKPRADEILGAGWEGTGDATKAIMQANVWMNTKTFCYNGDTVPDGLEVAAAYVAKLAAQDILYVTQTEGMVLEKRVKADSVEVQKKYSEATGASGIGADMQFITDMITPYLCGGFAINASILK